ncbi:hypothetical protein THAOC_15857 [Thalassiosira oceanica]|uniref:Uncharacterized protein n=1 Tax=Thalassiosira oceanica TaxID=159749 RepID=K0SEQ6_THAOC|nr:hypothetical protein THAOC_15857 [Thalassiosira oceanica]|eukprot:EJK63479.1 hypothetical protein THAOC_15857 [Thalassiosira oceanica]
MNRLHRVAPIRGGEEPDRGAVAARPQWVQGWVASDISAGDAPYERRVDLPRSLASPAVRGPAWVGPGHLGSADDWLRGRILPLPAAGVRALFNIGAAYDTGEDVQQDKAKAVEFYRKAAMQGHAQSRNNLGCIEWNKGNHDRAVRHFLISAKMGHEDSVENIKWAFMEGVGAKEQYAEALKGYQDAVEEMKSHDRDEAKRQYL